MIENDKYYIFASVKKYKDMMDLIVLYAAKSIFSINNEEFCTDFVVSALSGDSDPGNRSGVKNL